jgi:hypothetical protein
MRTSQPRPEIQPMSMTATAMNSATRVRVNQARFDATAAILTCCQRHAYPAFGRTSTIAKTKYANRGTNYPDRLMVVVTPSPIVGYHP